MKIAIIKNDRLDNAVLVDPVDADGVQLTALEHARQLMPAETLVEMPENACIGWLYDAATGALTAPPEPDQTGLRIEITSIAADAAHTEHLMLKGLQEVTCTVGTVLEAEAELRLKGQLAPFDDSFRMPMRSRDGRERVLLGRMTQGRIAFRVSLPESGVWRVTESGINEAVPAEQRMTFAGLTIYVVEA